MQTAILKQEAINLIDLMPENKISTIVQFIRFIYQQPEEYSAAKKRDENDIYLINTHSAKLNQGANENLDFQTDIFGAE